ncbi:MAG: hypothetical protein CMI16_04835 [Opitutaceae bacterium]|nr:hypothetical protein [Opitutaceae bacterium]
MFPLVAFRPSAAPAARSDRLHGLEAAVPLEHIVDAWRDLARSRGGTDVPMFAKKPDPQEMRARSDHRRRWLGTWSMAVAAFCLACTLTSVLYTVVRINKDIDNAVVALSPAGMGLVNNTANIFQAADHVTEHGSRMLVQSMPLMDHMMNNTDSIVDRLEYLLRHPTITLSLEAPTPGPHAPHT